MMERTNCPNCGAPIESERCPYCGTIIYDFANLEYGKDCWIRLKVDDKLRVFKARLDGIRANYKVEPLQFYADNTVVSTMQRGEMELEVVMTVVPDDDILVNIYLPE